MGRWAGKIRRLRNRDKKCWCQIWLDSRLAHAGTVYRSGDAEIVMQVQEHGFHANCVTGFLMFGGGRHDGYG